MKTTRRCTYVGKMSVRGEHPLAFSIRRGLGVATAVLLHVLLMAGGAAAQCVGDCDGDGRVGIGELITGVAIALGDRELAECPVFDSDGSATVGVGELIQAVGNALESCPSQGSPTPTPALPSTTPTSTATATPDRSGPPIVLFALSTADDRLIEATSVEGGIPVFELPQGRAFHIIAEAALSEHNTPPLRVTFRDGAAPDFQIQANRPLGDGSTEVCDGLAPTFGGVPAIDPPTFDDPTSMIVDALNDFGCRFQDSDEGGSQAIGRSCTEACLRFKDGTFGCQSGDAVVQFCSLVVSAAEEFPAGDTLLSARVIGNARDLGLVAGSVEQIIVRVVPPFP